MLKRYTPLRSSGPIKRKASIKRSGNHLRAVAEGKRAARLEYCRQAAIYLREHPFCQIYIARHELREDLVVAGDGRHRGHVVPRATTIHHRNKRWTEERLLDKRWWMSASIPQHDWVENNKDTARALGYLLPMQADENGRWGDGNQAVETPEFMRNHARR